MPRTAIARGYVDFVLSPEAIAAGLTALAHHPYIAADENIEIVDQLKTPDGTVDSSASWWNATGIDFQSH